MSIAEMAIRFGKIVSDNSPVILTAIGVTGTVATAFLTGKASFKAAEILAEADLAERLQPQAEVPLPIKEKVELVWKLYIPAVGTGLLTVVCIIGANRIGTRRAAAMAAAFKLSEKAFGEYREKIVQKIGANKEQAARDELAQERVERTPQKEIIIAGSGSVLCFDQYTGRYFLSSMEELKKAQNDLNYRILHDYYASLGDFYDMIGLPKTSMTDEVGWNADRMLELNFSTVMSEDGQPCLALDFEVTPIRNFYRIN